MILRELESPYWYVGSRLRIGWIKFKKGKGWSASLRLGNRSFLTEDLFPKEVFTLPRLRKRLADRYGLVVPMKDRLHLVQSKPDEQLYVV